MVRQLHLVGRASLTGVMQDRVASPSMITPCTRRISPVLQPNFVPTIP